MSRSPKPSYCQTPELPALIVLDACVLLNLHATSRIAEILPALSSRVLVSSFVSAEALWHETAAKGSGEVTGRQTVTLDLLVQSGVIEIVELTAQEQKIFLVLAQHLGDGEAASGAIAVERFGAVATDDRKARRVLGQHSPPIHTIGTANLLQAWELRAQIPAGEMELALRAIRIGARFEPGPNDDGSAWWRQRAATAAANERIVQE